MLFIFMFYFLNMHLANVGWVAPLWFKPREFYVAAGGEHSNRLVWKRYLGSGKEWNRQEWSLSHPDAGEDRPEKGPHTG